MLLKQLTQKSCVKLGDFSFITDGIHESIIFDDDSDIKLISAKSPKENYFVIEESDRIYSKQDDKNIRTQLRINDVIVSTVGTIGNCAVVTSEILPANADRHVGIIRLKNDYKPRFISSFLLSKYGRFQTFRESTGNVQLNLFIYKLVDLLIPELSLMSQNHVEDVCLKADLLRKQANKCISEAEQMLLSEIALHNWKPKHNLSFIGCYNNTILNCRMDAEHYQPKYDELINQIKKYTNGWKLSKDVLIINKQNYVPEHKVEYKYIELANIGNSGDILDCSIESGCDLPSRARRKVKSNEVLISSVEGSLDKVALIDDDYDGALCSTGFHIVSSKEINSETLLVFFKSIAGYEQLKKGCSGTILTAINQGEFDKMVIPIIRQEIQDKIKEQVTQSRNNLKEAKRLIEVAKRSVEIAIEESEEKAMEYINQFCG